MTGKKPWECQLESVKGAKTVDRDLTVLAGGMRERLGIQTTDGVEVFVVHNVKTKVSELRELFGE